MPATVDVPTADGPMPLYDSLAGSAVRGVIVLQEAFGVTQHMESVAERFAHAGYHAVIPHLFHRTGDPTFDYDDIESAMPHMQAVTGDGLLADLDASAQHLQGHGLAADRVAVVGYCMGGTMAFYAAAERSFGACVTYYSASLAQGRYGFPSQIDLGASLRSPWLGFYGDCDEFVAVEDVERLRGAVAQAAVDTAIVRYPDADHGFFCDARPSFHEPSADDSWRRVLQWFDEHLATG